MDDDLRTLLPVPGAESGPAPTRHEVAGIRAAEDCNIQHWIVAPIGGALIKSGLLPSGQIKESGLVATTWVTSRLAEIVKASPDELPDDVVMIAHTQPVVDFGAGLGAQKEAFREADVLGSIAIGAIQAVNVIIASDVEGIHEAIS